MSQLEYAPEEHRIGHGGTLEWADEEDGDYIIVVGTQEVANPERELGEAETTNDNSPGRTKSYTTGLYEPGTAPFTYLFQEDQFIQIEELYQLAADDSTSPEAIKWWRHTMPGGTVFTWPGYIKKNDMARDQEGVPVVEAEIRATGPMQTTPAGGS